MSEHPLLAEFQKECQSLFACYVFATRGVEHAKGMITSAAPPKGARVFISATDPTIKTATATLLAEDLVKMAKTDGEFFDLLAKSLLVSLYAKWDEYYRPLFAKDVGVEPKNVKCDLLGDLRLVRNCIVHAKSIVTNEHERLKVLSWNLSPGPLMITKDMLTVFTEATHTLVVQVHDVSA